MPPLFQNQLLMKYGRFTDENLIFKSKAKYKILKIIKYLY